MMVHVETLPFRNNGGIGVDIFFALSGWLITNLLLNEHRLSGAFDLQGFYIRRFFRIVPLYALTVALYCIAAGLLRLRGDVLTWNETLASLPYLLSFNPELRIHSELTFGHAWTLGVEEKFYLIWPAFLLIARGRAFVAIGAAMLLALSVTAAWDFNSAFVRGYGGLGCGALLAVIFDRSPRLVAAVACAPLALPIMFVIALLHTASLFLWVKQPGWNLAVSACGAVLVASLWLNREQAGSRLLALAPLAWVGKLTYGLYLIHVLVLNTWRQIGVTSPWSLLLLTYAGSVVVAWGLHVVVEKPLIARGRQLAARRRTVTALE